MLELKNITKDYSAAGEKVHALKGVSLKFRKNEFVSILGASGCGKTTLLNIIGGLDKYTSGDLLIEGVSTKQYSDRDWDTYRNHSIGFIFQSYHLIPHQTILQNVELALMIAGVDKEERRRRAVEALEKVGLADKIHSRPNQLSGGQAQRVAIARALINDPEIVLADEPTGALDSKTSVQIMEILKEISGDRLVIMVTHNPELAERYSTRIIRLLDGEVTDDSMPYDGEAGTANSGAGEKTLPDGEQLPESGESQKNTTVTNKGKKKKTSMSFGMAFSLSLKNLLSKRKRTVMVSVAGSIGIIGVSMVLAISAGVQAYISDMENDMLSGYPLSVTETAIDYDALLSFAGSSGTKVDLGKWNDKVYVDSLLDTLMDFGSSVTTNVITEDYRQFVESMPEEYYNAIQYGYNFDMSNYIYTDFTPVSTDGRTANVSVTGIRAIYTSVLKEQENYKDYADLIGTVSSFAEIPDNYEYILSQYDILTTYSGKSGELTSAELSDIFESEDSLIMVVDNNSFSDLNFAQYGYMTENEFLQFAYKAEGSQYDQEIIDKYNGMDSSFFIGPNAKTFKWYPNDAVYKKLTDEEKNSFEAYGYGKADFMYNAYSDGFTDAGLDLKVKVILQKKKGVSYGSLDSGLYYTKALTDRTIASSLGLNLGGEQFEKSEIVSFIEENGELSRLPFVYTYSYYGDNDEVIEKLGFSAITASSGFNLSAIMGGNIDTDELLKVGLKTVAGVSIPAAFYIYPVDFKTKDKICSYLDKWNDACESGTPLVFKTPDGTEHTLENLTEADKVNYNDTVGLIISMVNTMIEMVTVALVAFTALSLIVSTVMIGIITYVSVVERIKEIGILRAVGARKKDIKRLFNAETFIIGLAAGIVGIAVTYILSLVLNIVIGSLYGIFGIAALPVWQALIMVALSVALTLISGLVPASAAAKKDPVVALRTE